MYFMYHTFFWMEYKDFWAGYFKYDSRMPIGERSRTVIKIYK